MSVRVKVCGTTSYEDAMLAVDHGADLIGFIFVKESPRYIEPARALDILKRIPSFIDTVAVFADPEIQEVREVSEDGLINWIQLHGNEPPEFCESIDWSCLRTMKAFRVKDSEDIRKSAGYQTDAILFDSFDPSKLGGTGKQFDWSLLDSFYRRIFLAGGINPDNVIEAVDTGVYGIDACSGLEAEPGKKDPEKMKLFFERLHRL